MVRLLIIEFVIVFRQGDTGKCWYACLAGSLDVRIVQGDPDNKVSIWNYPGYSSTYSSHKIFQTIILIKPL